MGGKGHLGQEVGAKMRWPMMIPDPIHDIIFYIPIKGWLFCGFEAPHHDYDFF